jgi:hypothetical protein
MAVPMFLSESSVEAGAAAGLLLGNGVPLPSPHFVKSLESWTLRFFVAKYLIPNDLYA